MATSRDARRRNSQVGFKEDTSYLAAHYGNSSWKNGERSTSSLCTQRKTSTLTRNHTDSCNIGKRRDICTTPRVEESHALGDSPRQHLRKTTVRGRGRVEVGKDVTIRRAAGRGSRLVRPTLSEQLASIGKAAEGITADIRRTHGLKPVEGALLITPSKSFVVGRLQCRYPSPVYFYKHKCVYTFHHPFEATTITMEMFYRDMRALGIVDASGPLGRKNRQMRFKIDHPLCHYTKDYAHDDPSHFVVIDFSSELDAQRVEREVVPLVHRQSGSAR